MATQAMTKSNSPLAFIDQVPGLRQLLLLVGLAAAVAAGISIAIWSQGETHTLLYSNLSDRDAVEIVRALDAAGINHSYDSGSGVVRVADHQLHEARLLLASEGLPSSAGGGFEFLGEGGGLTSSQFMENARYQRALEIELQRTITSISAVRAARVHLAMPRHSVFVRERRPASASVLLSLHSGRRLEPAQVAAIVNLVASSVPDMERSQVSILDQHGTLLSADLNGDQVHAGELADRRAQQIEERLARRIEELLTPVVGFGRVRAQVSADLDMSAREETQEMFDAESPVVRSEQLSEEPGFGLNQRGIPGAVTNQPDAGIDADGNPVDDLGRPLMSRREVRNFEIGRTIRHTQMPMGSIRRLSVAVVLDQPRLPNADGELVPTPYPAEEIERLTALVGEAVGLDFERGDRISLINQPFLDMMSDEDWEIEEPGLLERIDVMGLLRLAAAVFLILMLIMLVVRPLMKQLSATPLPAPRALPAVQQQQLAVAGSESPLALEDGGGEVPAQIGGRRRAAEEDRPLTPKERYENLLDQARSAVSQDPKRVAQLMRQWVNEDGG